MPEFGVLMLNMKSALAGCMFKATKPAHAITTAHFVTFIIFICVRSFCWLRPSFSMCRAKRVLHLRNQRRGILQIVRLQRDTLTGDFYFGSFDTFSLFIESVRRSDVYRRQLRGIRGLYILHQRFTTAKRRMSEYLIVPLAKRRD